MKLTLDDGIPVEKEFQKIFFFPPFPKDLLLLSEDKLYSINRR